MKKIKFPSNMHTRILSIGLLASAFVTTSWLAACNSTPAEKSHTEEQGHQHQHAATPAEQAATSETATAITPSFKQVDPQAAAHIKTLVTDYLRIKNALVASNAQEAAAAGQQLAKSAAGFDGSLLSADQLKIYNAQIAAIKENATHIAGNKELPHQREHLADLTSPVYELVKAFGAGETVYYTHCPMAFDKGANWLSEVAEIKNPFYGQDMLSCGEIKETIQ
ncbi:DUF3347 domain-containing protein [Chitinophaga pendula]|uniref:DUF3347 domain-containing protein n=1 Tax=Chitinophaga TaxID=79328 RepID=UPI000BAE7947|nr:MULTISPECIES: DUF3347 domain-containing protein [Chitinophaga]ASZ12746.1 hypothetical protein CK934_18190 [Chitinophaga sp. MD30]UCJ09634.1 DUF3347 domain-containing protein [Chitinophaga pendula]